MSGRGRVTLAATVATALSAAALLPLVESATWFALCLLLLALVAGAGALARRAQLPRPLVVAIQALVALLLLTVVFARPQALAGFVPGPEAMRHFGQLFEAGQHDVRGYTIPAPLTDGITFLLIGGVLVVGLLVDTLAVTFRAASAAGLPLLALYSVATGIAEEGSGWLLFLLAAGGYLLLLLAESRDRVARWGRVFGVRAADGRGKPPKLSPVRNGRRIGVLALGVALVVPLALPALDGGLLAGRGGGGTGGGGGTISAVNPLVSLQDALNQPDDREVLRYRTDAANISDLYLRIVSLDKFDGTSWSPSERRITEVPDQLPQPTGLSPDVATGTVTTSVQVAGDYGQDWLPLPYPASSVDINGRWRYEPEGRTLVGERGQTTRNASYRVESLDVRPTARQLANARPAPEDIRRAYTSVPGNLPDVVEATARKVTKGAANDYERAVRLQDWFAYDGGFTYNTRVGAGSGPQAIARFLKQKEGFCVHFSFSMAAMARTLGIPARVAIGFTPGTQTGDEGTMSVGLRDAHAWPELYFQGVGWTRFEPTPSRGTTPEYTQPEAPEGDAASTAPEQPETSESAAPSTSASTDATCPAADRRLGECGGPSPQAVVAHGDDGPPTGTLLGVGLLVLVVLAVPLLPVLWRRRLRARRLGGGPGRDVSALGGRVRAAWAEVLDTAWDLGIPPDEALSPRAAAARLVRAGHLDEESAAALGRLVDALEHVRYAPAATPPPVAADVRRVLAGLRAGSGRTDRLRALFTPRSSAGRLGRALSARSAAVRERLAGWRRVRGTREAS
ncbi:transglutaminaseTgpA domain-containing protein [Streptomyces sp. NPDC088768]|uniref:transglutaminase family protein n=1 Tax=Streptomyces sp. NPDC088768 TaxID=3365894 RepID=UPI0038023F18